MLLLMPSSQRKEMNIWKLVYDYHTGMGDLTRTLPFLSGMTTNTWYITYACVLAFLNVNDF